MSILKKICERNKERHIDTMEFLCRHCKYEVHIEADEDDLEKVTCKGPSGEHHPEQEMVRND